MKDFELRYVGSHVEVYTGSGVFLFFSRYGAGGHGRAGRVSGGISHLGKLNVKCM